MKSRTTSPQKTPSCFEPTIDYVVAKIPKWQFEKFPGADTALGTQMKSVGEVMAIGRTFKEALQKGIRSLEPHTPWRAPAETPASLLREKLATPRPDRIHWLLRALERGVAASEICVAHKNRSVVHRAIGRDQRAEHAARRASRWRPFRRNCCARPSASARATSNWRKSGRRRRPPCGSQRHKAHVAPVFKRVDTCAAEFESFTPYLYSTYEDEDEADVTERRRS